MSGCASVNSDIDHLSPQFHVSPPPAQCRLVSVLKDSPAARGGLTAGDTILTINGQKPADAAVMADMVAKSPADATFTVATESGTGRSVPVHLNDNTPRLGAVCDLSGWNKGGLSPAGNESLTQFKGGYAVTLSGIKDRAKGLAILRAHIVNHSNEPVDLGPQVFSAKDGQGHEQPALTPIQVMCALYGEKGAKMLQQQPKRHVALDNDTAPALGGGSEGALCAGVQDTGRLNHSQIEYVEANAKSVADDSLWPVALAPGGTADGLVYFQAPATLPLTVSVRVKDDVFVIALGTPQATAQVMPAVSVAQFLERQKKGTPLRVTLKKGRVFVARFSSYDSLEDVAWFEATEGLLTSMSYPLRSIRSVQAIESK